MALVNLALLPRNLDGNYLDELFKEKLATSPF